MNFTNGAAPSAGWETLSRETHYANEHVAVATECVRSPGSDRPRSWTVVNRKPAVIVAPMLRTGDLVLIRQERIPARSALWEVPAGQIDEPAAHDRAAIEQVARRELREETGYQLSADGELIALGDLFSSPGFTDERAFLFLARGVEPSAEGHAHNESESIVDCRTFPAREIARMIANGEIRDSNTLAIFARLVAAGLLSFYS